LGAKSGVNSVQNQS